MKSNFCFSASTRLPSSAEAISAAGRGPVMDAEHEGNGAFFRIGECLRC